MSEVSPFTINHLENSGEKTKRLELYGIGLQI